VAPGLPVRLTFDARSAGPLICSRRPPSGGEPRQLPRKASFLNRPLLRDSRTGRGARGVFDRRPILAAVSRSCPPTEAFQKKRPAYTCHLSILPWSITSPGSPPDLPGFRRCGDQETTVRPGQAATFPAVPVLSHHTPLLSRRRSPGATLERTSDKPAPSSCSSSTHPATAIYQGARTTRLTRPSSPQSPHALPSTGRSTDSNLSRMPSPLASHHL